MHLSLETKDLTTVIYLSIFDYDLHAVQRIEKYQNSSYSGDIINQHTGTVQQNYLRMFLLLLFCCGFCFIFILHPPSFIYQMFSPMSGAHGRKKPLGRYLNKESQLQLE